MKGTSGRPQAAEGMTLVGQVAEDSVGAERHLPQAYNMINVHLQLLSSSREFI